MIVAERITADRETLGGRACIRGLSFGVADLLKLLAAGKSAEEIVAEHPFLELEDIPAVLRYAATVVGVRYEGPSPPPPDSPASAA